MKVQIDKSYPMPCAAQVAWDFLQDIEAVAACMPGAKITERLAAGRYKGTVTAKLGPATMAFRGEVEMLDVDPGSRSLRLLGKGTDSTGSSGASMNLTARIEASQASLCHLIGSSEVSMSGKAVAFGARMMSAVADQLLKQFADNFALRVGALQAQRDAVRPAGGAGGGCMDGGGEVHGGSGVHGGGAGSAGSVDGVGGVGGFDSVGNVSSVGGSGDGTSGGSDASRARVLAGTGSIAEIAAPLAAPAVVEKLDGLTLLWAVFKDWLRGLLAKKPV